jgi:hypothetical protein
VAEVLLRKETIEKLLLRSEITGKYVLSGKVVLNRI